MLPPFGLRRVPRRSLATSSESAASCGQAAYSKALGRVLPRDVIAGVPVTVQLSIDEIRAVAADLRDKMK